jgi:hypothetical protein
MNALENDKEISGQKTPEQVSDDSSFQYFLLVSFEDKLHGF